MQQREYTRFVEFNDQRMVIDELTDASERLAMVMHNPFEFEMGGDGELHAEDGSNLGEVLRNSVLVAEEIVRTNPQFMTELIRRRIELQEYDEQRRLALGSEGDPDVMVVLSPIPDAVLYDGVDLGAYDTARKKTLVRIFERTEEGIRSTSISLDGTDRRGLQAIAGQFGQTITDDAGSEDILAMRLWGYSSVLNDPIKTVRRRYDEQLEQQFGGKWYGGRQDGDVMDAMSFIVQQTDIVEAHMRRVRQIPQSDKKALENARFDFAATLDDRRQGVTRIGGGAVDLAASGNVARSEGREYKGDCPTADVQAQSQDPNDPSRAQEAAKKLYEKSEVKAMTCPFCGLTTYGDPCAFRLVCTRCSAEVRGGRIFSRGIGRKAALAKEEQERQEQKAKVEKHVAVSRKMAETVMPTVFEMQGRYYENIEMIGIGGIVQDTREVSRGEWERKRREDYGLGA